MNKKFYITFSIACALWLLAGFCWGKALAAPFTPEMETAYIQAEEYWHAEPAQCTTITKEAIAGLTSGGIEVGGTATEPEADWIGPCVININGNDPPCSIQHVMDHEVGHLLGHDHSEGGVMDPGYTYPECQVSITPEEAAKEQREWQAVNQRIRKIRANERRWRHHAVVHNDRIANPVS